MSILSSALGGIGHVVSNIGSTVKKAAVDTGHTVGAVADNGWTKAALAAALAATGVGAPAAAAILASEGIAGGALKKGGNLGSAVKGGVTGAATGALAGGAGGLLKGVLSTAAPVLGGGGGGMVGPDGTVENGGAAGDAETGGRDWGSILKGIVSGGGSDGKGNLGVLGDLAGKLTNSGTPGGSSLLDKLLLGGSAAASAADALDKKKLRDRASDYATGSYDAKAPLRDRALALLKDPEKPDLSSIFADPGNVYDAQRRTGTPLGAAQPASDMPAADAAPSIPLRAPMRAADRAPSIPMATPLVRRLLAPAPEMRRAV